MTRSRLIARDKDRAEIDNSGISTYSDGTKIFHNQYGEIHRVDGPAVVSPDGRDEWYVDSIRLKSEEVQTAKGILSGKLFESIPLYVNHHIFKYFCMDALSKMGTPYV